MNAAVCKISSLNVSSFANVEELIFLAREQRCEVGTQRALLLVKELATALKQQRKMNETCLTDGYVRGKSLERLLLKELGIWCYLAYLLGASPEYLKQSEVCLSRLCNLQGTDAELEMYYAFVLWSKWQNKSALPGDMSRCFALLSHCAETESFQVSQAEVVWFRLGYLYQIGAGCKQDLNKAEMCFERARNLGLDC